MPSLASDRTDRPTDPLERRAGLRRSLNVCVVAHLAFGAITGRKGHVGGVEKQASLLARWLAARGHRVSMITWDEGQVEPIVDGVRVIKLCREDSGIPVMRFFHPRWSSLVRALSAAGADLYFQSGGEYQTGQVALWCRRHGRRFVFSAASNSDCDARLPLMTSAHERTLYRVGLRCADAVVVQTDAQRRMMRENFGRESTAVPMPCQPQAAPPGQASFAARRRIVWIGRICEVKQPERLLDLAGRCVDLQFDLVGPDDGSQYSRRILERARRLPNVEVHGRMSESEIAALLDLAVCLCCTSDIEGFPNTFLEAWSRGVPLLTTFDPDGIVARERLGWTVADAGGLEVSLRLLLADDAAWSETSERARTYFARQHAADAALPRFEALLAGALAVPA